MEAPDIKELADFTLQSYTKLLQYLSQVYKIVPFCEIPQKDTSYLILRHDIDNSLPASLKMAQIERDLGIRSTYFVLFSSRFYNVLEGDNANILKQISRLGHEVGLHYSPYQYQSYGRNTNKTLKIEIQLLEHLLGKKVYSIARHGGMDRDPFTTIRGFINANNPHLRRDLYIHDSCRAWTTLESLFKLLNDPPRRVQLLTHPENWQDDKIDRETLLKRFIQSSEKEVSKLEDDMKKIWLTDPLVIEYDRLVKKLNILQSNTTEYRLDKTNTKLQQELNYYNTLFKWHIMNTSWGWHLHLALEKIRNKLAS